MAAFSVRLPQLPGHVLKPFPHDPSARSYIGGRSTTIYFVNHLPDGFSAEIYRIGDGGERILWHDSSELHKSEYFEVTAYIHQPWEVVFTRVGETITKIYYPELDPSCVMLDKSVFPIPRLVAILPSSIPEPRSFQESRPTRITFENHLRTKVLIRWLDFSGIRRTYGSIPPGFSSSQPTYVGHVWEVVIADIGKKPVALFYAAPYEGLAEIDDRFLNEPSDGV